MSKYQHTFKYYVIATIPLAIDYEKNRKNETEVTI
jgi:hypothetical protein